MASPIDQTGDIARAMTKVLGIIRDLETEIVKHGDPDWIADHGPVVEKVSDANVLFYRDIDSVRPFNRMPQGDDDFDFSSAAKAYLQLAATSLKIAVDFETHYQAEEARFRRLVRSKALAGIGEEDE